MTTCFKLVRNRTGRLIHLLGANLRMEPMEVPGNSTSSIPSEYYVGDHYKSLVGCGDLFFIRDQMVKPEPVAIELSAKQEIKPRRSGKTPSKKTVASKSVAAGVDGK